MVLEEILTAGFAALSLPLDETALRRYRLYYDTLSEQNKVMNLTAIEGEADSARLHFLDCAALLTLADFRGRSVIDVGSGAGFPGLALKIAIPELRLTLLDSLDKRVRFLQNTCAALGFDDVRCVHARAEEAPADFRQGFDLRLGSVLQHQPRMAGRKYAALSFRFCPGHIFRVVFDLHGVTVAAPVAEQPAVGRVLPDGKAHFFSHRPGEDLRLTFDGCLGQIALTAECKYARNDNACRKEERCLADQTGFSSFDHLFPLLHVSMFFPLILQ